MKRWGIQRRPASTGIQILVGSLVSGRNPKQESYRDLTMTLDAFPGNVFVTVHSQWHAAAHYMETLESTFGDRMGWLRW